VATEVLYTRNLMTVINLFPTACQQIAMISCVGKGRLDGRERETGTHASSCKRISSFFSLKCDLISFSTAYQYHPMRSGLLNIHGNGGFSILLAIASMITIRRTLAEYDLLSALCILSEFESDTSGWFHLLRSSWPSPAR
jgi:hypothetical protein